MIAALSPANYNYEETLSTLRYADRAKSIKNKPRINEDPKDALLKQYESEIQELKQMLMQMQQQGCTGEQMQTAMQNMQKTMDKHQVIDHVEENVDALLQKLEGQLGEKVKILTEEEEQAEKELKAKVARELQERMHSIRNQKEQVAVEKEQIEQELQNQEEQITQEKQEKQQLEQILAKMNNKLIAGGQEMEAKEAEHYKEQKAFQEKLKEQRAKA